MTKIRKNLRIDPELMKHIDSQPLAKKNGFTWYVERALEKVSKFKSKERV